MSEEKVPFEITATPPDHPSTRDVSNVPETGWQAWTTLFGAVLVQFSTFGYANAYGVYQDYYVRRYLTNYTPSDIAWIGGMQIFLMFASGIWTGHAFDKGYFYHLLIGGAVLYSFSFFMVSLSHEDQYYQLLLSQGVGGGLGIGLVYIPSLSVISHHFLRRRPLAMGIVSSGAGLGAVIHPIMLNNLFHGSVGFHNGVRISAGMNAGLLIIAILVMRTRLPPKKTGSTMPIREFLKDTPYVVLVASSFLQTIGIFFPIFFLQLYAVSHGIDKQFALYCIAIMNATSILGRILPTLIVRRYGIMNLVICFSSCMCIMIYCLGFVKSSTGIAVYSAIYGLFPGAVISLIPPVIASLAKDTNEVGARLGISYTFSGISGLIATPIEGALLTTKFHWWRPVIFSGTTIVIGVSLLVVSRFLLVRQRGTRIV